jgi:predicted ATPase
MIHIDRVVPGPAILISPQALTARQNARKSFTDTKLKLTTYAFDATVYEHPEVVVSLYELFHGKCAFCESLVPMEDPRFRYLRSSVSSELRFLFPNEIVEQGPLRLKTRFFETHHFRPKMMAMDLQGVVSGNHYWWLAYEWSNLYLACAPCNSLKATRFPIKAASRAAPESPLKALADEKALLLDPCADQPEEHLVFLTDGKVAGDTEQGIATIAVYGLNRDQLISGRKNLYQSLAAEYAARIKQLGKDGIPEDNTLRQALDDNLSPAKPYTALRRQFIKQWLHEIGITDWTEFLASASKKRRLVSARHRKTTSGKFATRNKRHATYSVEKTKQADVYYSGAKRIERIEIRNFKAIENLVLTFPSGQSEQDPWLMIIGENGCGKSSILQAVALALMGERHVMELGLDARRYVRAKAKDGKGFVKVHLTNIPEPIVLSFDKKSRHFRVIPKDPKVLLLGYGATRLLPQHTAEKASRAKYIRIKNLFVPTAPLNDAEVWLSNTKTVPRSRFVNVEKAFQDLLMLDKTARFSRNRGVVSVKTADGPITLHDLSDGFQSVVAMCADIMISLLERWDDMQVAEGIVLLDEIEGHLHPSWKIEIVQRLRRCFPRVTFLATTHDPLCLKGLNDCEVVVLRRDEANRVRIMSSVPEFDDLRADQILTNPQLFGLPSTIGKTPQAIGRYSELVKKRRRSSEEKAELDGLRVQLNKLFSSGETPLERQIETAVQKVLTETDLPPSEETVKRSTKSQTQPLNADGEELRLRIRSQLNRLFRK